MKVLGDNGGGSQVGILKSIDWIAANGNKPAVWSASLGGPGRSHSYETAFRKARSKGVTISVAAGNDNSDACSFSPAHAPSAITVGSTDQRDSRSGFSNFGKCVDIFAPGSSITSASARDDRGSATMSGTSMACPHVSGMLALLLGDNAGMTSSGAEAALKKMAHANLVRDAKRDSPNLLLYTGTGGGQPTTPPTPAPTPAPQALGHQSLTFFCFLSGCFVGLKS